MNNMKMQQILSVLITLTNGDEGWYFVQDSWLKDFNYDKKVDIIIRRRDNDQDLDDSTKVTQKDSLIVWLNLDTQFKKTRFKLDTTKYKLHNWNR